LKLWDAGRNAPTKVPLKQNPSLILG